MSEATQSTSPAVNAKNPAMMLALDAILIAIVSTFVAVAVLKFIGPTLIETPQQRQLAIVNVDELIQEYVNGMNAQVTAGAVSAADMPTRSAAFNRDVQQRLQAYAQAGVTVLRSDSVIVAPDEIEDITQKLRNELHQSGLIPRQAVAPAAPAPQVAAPADAR